MDLETSAVVEAPVTETAAPEPRTPEVPDPSAAAPSEPPSYAPNYKFKVHDKEMEFDPWLHGAIKDADTEKKARELYEKAFGLDYVKQDRSRLRDENGNLRTERDSVMSQVNQLISLRDKGDLDTFFEKVGLDEDKLLRHALQIVQRRNNPEADAQYRQSRQFAQQNDAFTSREAQLNEQLMTVQRTAKEFELRQAMSRPDVIAAMDDFDARLGSGAFQSEVIRRGLLAWTTNQQDISAEQAVSEVLQLIGFQGNASQGSQMATPANQVVQPTTQQQKPTLPNIQGRGTSPVAKTPRSIADLRAMGQRAS